MSEDVRRTIAESKKKMQDVAKQSYRDQTGETKVRDSPGGRRLAELRKRKARGD